MVLEQLLTNDSSLVTAIVIICAIPVTLFIAEWIKRSIYRVRWNRKHRQDKMKMEELLDVVMRMILK